MHKHLGKTWYHQVVNRIRRPAGNPLFLSLSSANVSDADNGQVLRSPSSDPLRFADAIVPPLIVVFVFVLSFAFPGHAPQGLQAEFATPGFPAATRYLAQFLPHFSQHQQPVQTISILLINPNAKEQLMAKTALERCGYRLLLADDSEQGIELFGRMPDQIPVVMLDWTASSASGATVLRRLRSIRPNVKVIASSADPGPSARRHFSGQGLAGFIRAPYTADELRSTLDTVLRNAGKS